MPNSIHVVTTPSPCSRASPKGRARKENLKVLLVPRLQGRDPQALNALRIQNTVDAFGAKRRQKDVLGFGPKQSVGDQSLVNLGMQQMAEPVKIVFQDHST